MGLPELIDISDSIALELTMGDLRLSVERKDASSTQALPGAGTRPVPAPAVASQTTPSAPAAQPDPAKDRGLEDRLPEVLEEAGRVRRELGYPHMSTPFSQFVGVQAVMNVIQGERYANPPEALRIYARGGFGQTIAEMDQDVRDRLANGLPEIDPLEGLDEPLIPKIRAEHGPFESDEDLLTFLFLHPAAYQDYRANRKPIIDRPRLHPVVYLAEELMARKNLSQVEVALGDSLNLKVRNS